MTRRSRNRLTCPACILFCFTSLAGCGGGGDDTVSLPEKRADGSKLSADDRAAGDFVRNKLQETWIKTADGWTTQLQLRNMLGQVMPGTPDTLYRQFRELKFNIKPEELTETMRLNGADYRCVIEFDQSPARYYRTVQTFEGPQGWSQWQDGDLMFRSLAVERRKGQWIIQDDDLFSGLKPVATEVPSG